MTSRAKGMLMALVLLLVLAGGIGLSLWLSGGEPASLLASKAFAKSGEILKNPVMGFAPEADYLEAAADNTLVYVDVSWRELEPSEGVFAFEAIEKANHLDEWRAAGKHVVFRFVCDLPGDEPHRDIPDWLYEKTKDGKDYDISYGKGYSPNYANRVFIEAHAKAIAALGKRFGQDTFFSYVELGSLGHWGEWHVKYEDGLPRMPGEAVRRQYIAPYLTAFPHAKILMRRPFVDAKKENFGLFNDMAGDRESTEEWLDWIANGGDYAQAGETDALVAMPSVWETAPVGGEFTSRYSFAELLGPRAAGNRRPRPAEPHHLSRPEMPAWLQRKRRRGAAGRGRRDLEKPGLPPARPGGRHCRQRLGSRAGGRAPVGERRGGAPILGLARLPVYPERQRQGALENTGGYPAVRADGKQGNPHPHDGGSGAAVQAGREAVRRGGGSVHRRPGGLSRHGRAAAGYPVRPV